MKRTLLALAVPLALVLSACGGSGNATTASSGATGGAPEAGSNIEFIVPSAAGGGNDILARIIAPVSDATTTSVKRVR